jgi:hypothetical protein
VKKDKWYMITTPWMKFFYEYLLEDEQELSVGEMQPRPLGGERDAGPRSRKTMGPRHTYT